MANKRTRIWYAVYAPAHTVCKEELCVGTSERFSPHDIPLFFCCTHPPLSNDKHSRSRRAISQEFLDCLDSIRFSLSVSLRLTFLIVTWVKKKCTKKKKIFFFVKFGRRHLELNAAIVYEFEFLFFY